MTKTKISGPAVTLGVAAALGLGLFAVNVAQEEQPAPAPAAATASATPPASAPPAPPTSNTPVPQQFPAYAEYVADIPISTGVIVLEITVDGSVARAYACDNAGIEEWLTGSAVDGVLDLTNETSALDARLVDENVVGILSIGDKDWDFTATPADADV